MKSYIRSLSTTIALTAFGLGRMASYRGGQAPRLFPKTLQ
jgi:hypothetical protein